MVFRPPLPHPACTAYALEAGDCKQPLEGPVAGRDEHLLLGAGLEPLTPDCTAYWLDDRILEIDINLDPHSTPSLAQPHCKAGFWSRQYEYTETLPWRLLLYARLVEALTPTHHHQQQ